MTNKHLSLLAIAAVITIVVAATSRLRTGRQDRAPSPANTAYEGDSPLAEVPRDANVVAREVDSGSLPGAVLLPARLRGVVRVPGGGSKESFARMGIRIAASSGRAHETRVLPDGRFEAVLSLPDSDCTGEIEVTLDTEPGAKVGGRRMVERLRLSKTPAAGTTESGPGYEGWVAFDLPDRCTIKGRSVDLEGKALSGVTVALVLLSPVDDSSQVLVESTTDATGRFLLEAPLLPEVLLAVAERSRLPEARMFSTLLGGEVDAGAIQLRPGEEIRGEVLWNEAERKHGGIQVKASLRPERVILLGSEFFLSLSADRLRYFAVSSVVQDGRFVLPGLEPRTYSLDLGKRDSACSLPGLVDSSMLVTAPAEVALDPRGPQLWIDARDALADQPVLASLRVTGAFGEFRCSTDRAGTGLILCGPDTDYQVVVEAPGYEAFPLALRSPGVNAFLEQRVELRPLPTGNLALELDHSWSGRCHLNLHLQGGGQAKDYELEVVDGRIAVESLPPGFYEGRLELWGAGTLVGADPAESVRLAFSARVRAGETATQNVAVR